MNPSGNSQKLVVGTSGVPLLAKMELQIELSLEKAQR
jgi:hypothetical protein